ncbi:hypothetical protein KY951_001337 [Vibrio parahaemolyticus]|nr:hypothetical protein [Vibrio parahaemolyticus]EHU5159167.1 hypothetical protein [Vibrio parahaemolyticus]EKA7364069.1 hypothetical protein [Vibrio parahaemolyticus]
MTANQLIDGVRINFVDLTEQQPTYILGQPTLSNKLAINNNTPSQRLLSYAKCTGTNMVDILLSLEIAQSTSS